MYKGKLEWPKRVVALNFLFAKSPSQKGGVCDTSTYAVSLCQGGRYNPSHLSEGVCNTW